MSDLLTFLIDRGYLLAAAFLAMLIMCHSERLNDKKVHRTLYQEALKRFGAVSDVLLIIKDRLDRHNNHL